jgi:hypothetical protein
MEAIPGCYVKSRHIIEGMLKKWGSSAAITIDYAMNHRIDIKKDSLADLRCIIARLADPKSTKHIGHALTSVERKHLRTKATIIDEILRMRYSLRTL